MKDTVALGSNTILMNIFLCHHISKAILFAFIAAAVAVSAEPPLPVFSKQEKLDYLKKKLYTHQEVDDWLSGRAFLKTKYDPELGYVPNSRTAEHGMDGALIHYNIDDSGARRTIAYADRPCRINSYGGSHVNCEQVQDGETFQEILAGHLCEPVRNFGDSGSLYQAYLRMKRVEKTHPADVIIFGLYDDPFYRNSYSWQTFRFGKNDQHISPTMPYLKVDWETKEVTEVPNLCPTQESLYNLCDLDWTYETFKDDLIMNLAMGSPNQQLLFMPDADTIYHQLAMLTSKYVIDLVADYADKNKKKILFVLSYHRINFRKKIQDNYRFDQEIVDHLDSKNLSYVDMMQEHVEDFANHNLTAEEYLEIYYIGHYNPRGVFFYAFNLKDTLVELLTPKPVPYQE